MDKLLTFEQLVKAHREGAVRLSKRGQEIAPRAVRFNEAFLRDVQLLFAVACTVDGGVIAPALYFALPCDERGDLASAGDFIRLVKTNF